MLPVLDFYVFSLKKKRKVCLSALFSTICLIQDKYSIRGFVRQIVIFDFSRLLLVSPFYL